MVATAQFREGGERRSLAGRLGDFCRNTGRNIFRKSGGRGPWWKLRTSTIIALAVLTLGLGGRILEVSWADWVRVKAFDVYQILKPRVPMAGLPVGIIDLDEKSLFEIGQWPWPRTVIADLLNRLADAGAAGVAFDMVFPEADRTSPALIANSIRGLDNETKGKLNSLPSNDDVLAAAMQRIPTVVGQVGLNDPLPEGKNPPSYKSVVQGVRGIGEGFPLGFIRTEYRTFMGNVPVLEKAARGHGIFSVGEEPDGVVRRVPLLSRVDKEIRPALSIELLRVALGGSIVFVTRDPAGISDITIQRKGQPGYQIPTDAFGRIWVYFAKPDEYNTKNNSGRLYISASDIIQGKIDPNRLRGKLFFVGTSAVGLLDIRATPISPRQPGVEVHANILENIITASNTKFDRRQALAKQSDEEIKKNGWGPDSTELKEYVQKQNTKINQIEDYDFYLKYPPIANSLELAMILFAGLFMIIFIPRLGPMLTLAGIAVAGAVLLGGSWYLFSEHMTFIDVTYPGIVTIALYSVLTFANYTREAAEKKQVRGAFAQYLSPALVEQLADHPEKLKLGGETKEMTFLFCDVRGFTAISETFKSNPQGLTVLINRLLTPLTRAILARQGTIDKYMGDCIMAFWNAPLDDENHAVNACHAALAMFVALDALNEERRIEAEEAGVKFLPLNVGAGINTGECVVGNMGSDQRFDYSVLGDPVNLAARLESQSKNYGVKVVLGPKTGNEADKAGFATLELDLIQVKGQSVGVNIHCLLGDSTFSAREDYRTLRAKHDEFISNYRHQHWDIAEAIMKECRSMARTMDLGMDVLYDMYTERLEEYRDVPPPIGWDGVYVATEK
jgi:adenylate cyclase